MLRDKRKRGKRNTSPITSCVRWPKVPSKRGLVGCGRGVLDEGGRKERCCYMLHSCQLSLWDTWWLVLTCVDLCWLVKTTYDFWVLLTISDHHWTLVTTVDCCWLLFTIVDHRYLLLTSLTLCWNRHTIKSTRKVNVGEREREEIEGDGRGNVWSLRIWWEGGWGREGGREGGRKTTGCLDASSGLKWAVEEGKWSIGEDVLMVNSQREEEMRGRRWSTSWLRNDPKSRYQCEKRADGLLFGWSKSRRMVFEVSWGGDQLVCSSKGPKNVIGAATKLDWSEVEMRRHRSRGDIVVMWRGWRVDILFCPNVSYHLWTVSKGANRAGM